MFSYPARELFSAAGDRRVVWSTEEYEAALSEGWSEERAEGSAAADAEPAAGSSSDEPAKKGKGKGKGKPKE